MKIKGVKCVYESESICKAIITMRKPKPQSLIYVESLKQPKKL